MVSKYRKCKEVYRVRILVLYFIFLGDLLQSIALYFTDNLLRYFSSTSTSGASSIHLSCSSKICKQTKQDGTTPAVLRKSIRVRGKKNLG